MRMVPTQGDDESSARIRESVWVVRFVRSDSQLSPKITAAGPRRRAAASKSASGGRPTPGQGGMMKIYTDDSPGIRVDPVVVLVGSLTFIASVFILHIVGKYTRA
ncbi:Sec61beta family-domain-containing protein [Zopfochytrium polystomum]|nr:Sec61beta family-domain-containing protein [Zopfochytrium polystomum]